MAIEDDLITACLESEGDVVVDVLGGQLEPDRDASRHLAYFVRDRTEVLWFDEVREGRRRDRCLSRVEPSDLHRLLHRIASHG